MFLYHASPNVFTKPEPKFFEESRDFGPCLYTSESKYDAEQYADRRLNGGHVLRLDVDIDHLDYSHTYNGLYIYVFNYQLNEDILLWMRTVIGNRIINRTGYNSFLDDIKDIDIFVGLRADRDLDKIINMFAMKPEVLYDDKKLLTAFKEELLGQYEMDWQVALTAKACEVLIDENINPLIEV